MMLNKQHGHLRTLPRNRLRMVSRSVHPSVQHSGQDPKLELFQSESRTDQGCFTEQKQVFEVDVDTYLLTGDLDQDIAILSVVA